MTINSFEELESWEDARELAKVVRLFTKTELISIQRKRAGFFPSLSSLC